MKIKKEELKSNLEKFSNIKKITDKFFKDKLYQKKGFLKKFMSDVKPFFKISKKRAYLFLSQYYIQNKRISKLNELDKNINIQNGGFLHNKFDNKYVRTLSTIDFLIDIVALIPNRMLTDNLNNVKLPYGLVSLLLNLIRGDYDFAFYSLLSIIPGIGSILAASSKIIHRIIRYANNTENIKDIEGYYKQIQSVRRVHSFLNDDKYEKMDNPYLTSFESNFDLKEIDDLYIK